MPSRGGSDKMHTEMEIVHMTTRNSCLNLLLITIPLFLDLHIFLLAHLVLAAGYTLTN